MPDIVLFIFAFVFFLLAALGVPPPSSPQPWPRINLIALGLACWVATLIF